MAGDRLTKEHRLQQSVTRLKKGIEKRDTHILYLEGQVKDLTQKLTDLGFQFEQMKAIVFGKKGNLKKLLDDEEDEPPHTPRTKESYVRPIPDTITATVDHNLPQGIFKKTRTKTFYVEDIPLAISKTVTKHTVVQGFDGISWIGKIPVPTSRVLLGDNARMLIATLSVEQRLSYSQIQQLLELLYSIHVSQGEITNILTKEASHLVVASETILQLIQDEKYHHMDETSWKVSGEASYAWSITGARGSTHYGLGLSRGKGNAVRLRGKSTGVLISDDYGAYKNLATNHQLCFAHLIRKFRDIASHPDFTGILHENLVSQYTEVKQLFKDIKQTLTEKEPVNKKHIFEEKMKSLSVVQTTDPPPLVRVKTTLRKNIHKYLTCFHFPYIPLTNNIAEQSLRHLVIKRRISFGSATHKGARTLSILMTVIKEILRTNRGNYFEVYRGMRV